MTTAPDATEVLPVVRPVSASPRSNGGWHVDVCTTAEGFDTLRETWDHVLEQSRARVFQTFEWQRTWWKHFGEGRKRCHLHIIMIREGEHVVGLAPFFIEDILPWTPLRYRRLGFIGRGASDYLDILAWQTKEQDVIARLAEYLADHQSLFDVLLLEEMIDPSRTSSRLSALLHERGFAGDRFLSEYCPRMQLHETWESTAAAFPSAHRNRLLKRMKVVREEFGAVYEHVTAAADIEAGIDDFIRIHQKRWNDIGHKGVFGDSQVDRFHRDVVRHLHRRGWLFLGFLRVGGERMVGDYGLLFRNEFATYLGGAVGDDQFLRQSPGRVLLMNIMKECVSLGADVFDFMRGTERYKYAFGAIDVPNWTILMYPRRQGWFERTHRLALLRDALGRRMSHEWLQMRHQARSSGLFSSAFAGYLLKRIRTVFLDALQKVRQPEKTLIISRGEG